MKPFVPLAILGGLMLLALDNDSASAQSCVGNRNMCDALSSLEMARNALLRADANKGGYRKEAIRSTERAISQTRMGIQYSQGR